MNYNFIRLITLNVLLLVLFTTSTHGVMYSRKSVSKEKYNSKLFIILNLKNSQIKDYLQNQKDDEVFFENSNVKLRMLRSQFQTKLYDQQFDTEKIQSLKQQLIDHETKRLNQKLRYILNVRRILTPNQYKEWLSIRKNPNLLKSYNKSKNPYLTK